MSECMSALAPSVARRARLALARYATVAGLAHDAAADELACAALRRGSLGDAQSEVALAVSNDATRLPLRRQLIVAMLAEMRDRRREERRAGGGCSGCGCATPCEVALDPSAFEQYESAWAREAMRDAGVEAARVLASAGASDAWTIFARHALERESYAKISATRGISLADTRALGTRGANEFERALRSELLFEGLDESTLDEDLAWLLEVSQR